MKEVHEAIGQIAALVENITVVSKGAGRESGLTGGDRRLYDNALQTLARKLDDDASTITNLQTELQAKDDEIARLTSEIDQLKADLARDPNVSSM